MSGGGGGKKGGGSGSYDYYGSVVGLLGWGPAEQLNALIADGAEVWAAEDPILRSESANPFVFDVEGYGRCHFYWGTDDQVGVDPVTTVAERDHPPYRHRVFIVLEDFLFGRERTTAPDISVVWSREPAATLLPQAPLDADGQAHPISFALEVLTDSLNGAGLAQDHFDLASWEAVHAAIDADSATEVLTMTLSEKITAKGFLQKLADYLDIWIRTNEEGKLEAGRWAGDGEEEMRVVTMADLVAHSNPTLDTESLQETSGRVAVEYIEPANGYQEDFVLFQNAARRDDFGQDNAIELQRPWIRRGSQAGAMAARVGERVAQPGATISLELRESKAVGMIPGTRFVFSRPDLDWSGVFRVVTRTGDSDEGGAVSIVAERDRVVSAGIYVGGSSGFDSEDAFELGELDYWDAIQLPPALAGNELYRVAFVAGRTQGLVSTSSAFLRAENATEFQSLGIQRGWAVPFLLDAAYADTVVEDDETGNLKVEVRVDALGFDELDAAPTSDEVADDKWLVFLVKASDPDEFEICTLRSIEPPTAGVYPLHVWRARFGTARLSFAIGDRAYILQRSSLSWFEWRGLKSRALGGNPDVDLKLIPSTASESFPIADATAKTLDLRDQSNEAILAGLYDGQTALQQETADLDDRVTALENPPP